MLDHPSLEVVDVDLLHAVDHAPLARLWAALHWRNILRPLDIVLPALAIQPCCGVFGVSFDYLPVLPVAVGRCDQFIWRHAGFHRRSEFLLCLLPATLHAAAVWICLPEKIKTFWRFRASIALCERDVSLSLFFWF